jgi:hypothetical protein
VSRLGKILRMSFLPLRSFSERELRSVFTSVNSGAWLPFAGRLPDVFTGFPLNVMFAITFSSKLVKK